MVTNPLITYGYEGPEYFCDRVEETQKLESLLRNGNNTVLMSPRRMGKTGLLYHCFNQPQVQKDYRTFIIDIYATKNLDEMTIAIGKAIVNQLKPFGRKAVDGFLSVVQSLRTTITFDSCGMPSLNLDLGTLHYARNTLDEIFNYIEKSDKPLFIAIDEFQQIMYYPEKNVEAILRTRIQNCHNAIFVFSGSERHLLAEMFHSPARPFFASTATLPLEVIDKNVYVGFALRQFENFGRKMDIEVPSKVYDRFEGITWYMQKTLNYLFKNTPEGSICTVDMIDKAINEIVNDSCNIYADLLYQLSLRQKELLIAINKEGKASQIHGNEFRKKYHLAAASTYQTAIKSLTEKQIVTSFLGVYEVYDKFFGIWLDRL